MIWENWLIFFQISSLVKEYDQSSQRALEHIFSSSAIKLHKEFLQQKKFFLSFKREQRYIVLFYASILAILVHNSKFIEPQIQAYANLMLFPFFIFILYKFNQVISNNEKQIKQAEQRWQNELFDTVLIRRVAEEQSAYLSHLSQLLLADRYASFQNSENRYTLWYHCNFWQCFASVSGPESLQVFCDLFTRYFNQKRRFFAQTYTNFNEQFLVEEEELFVVLEESNEDSDSELEGRSDTYSSKRSRCFNKSKLKRPPRSP